MHVLRVAAPLLGLSLMLAACGGAAATPTPLPATPAPATPAASAPAASTPAAGAAVALADSSLGKILVDGKGVTLYVFTPDSAGKSACYDDCAKAWPPLVSGAAPTLGAGLDAEDFATIDRTDGGKQVTFYGMPVYYFAGDTAAGQTNGQGKGDKWFVVGADGKMIKPATAGATVKLADSSLGKILVDGRGLTLYAFTPDTAGTSTCYGGCATAWPPLTSAAAPTPGAGLNAADFALVDRTDGGKQVTFKGIPLYFFASDAAKGDTKGQGLGGKWYVIGADGKLIK